jgi:hypothetical protein
MTNDMSNAQRKADTGHGTNVRSPQKPPKSNPEDLTTKRTGTVGQRTLPAVPVQGTAYGLPNRQHVPTAAPIDWPVAMLDGSATKRAYDHLAEYPRPNVQGFLADVLQETYVQYPRALAAVQDLPVIFGQPCAPILRADKVRDLPRRTQCKHESCVALLTSRPPLPVIAYRAARDAVVYVTRANQAGRMSEAVKGSAGHFSVQAVKAELAARDDLLKTRTLDEWHDELAGRQMMRAADSGIQHAFTGTLRTAASDGAWKVAAERALPNLPTLAALIEVTQGGVTGKAGRPVGGIAALARSTGKDHGAGRAAIKTAGQREWLVLLDVLDGLRQREDTSTMAVPVPVPVSELAARGEDIQAQARTALAMRRSEALLIRKRMTVAARLAASQPNGPAPSWLPTGTRGLPKSVTPEG